MPVKYDYYFIYMAAVIALLVLGRLFSSKMKYIGKIISSFIIGCIVLIIINFIGSYFGFSLPLNPVSAFITGLLGIPGLIMLVILKYIFII